MSRLFRKKPVVIEAVQWSGSNIEELKEFMGVIVINFGRVIVHTEEGYMRAEEGDWIIRGVKGEFYPCKPGIFDLTYEAVR